VKGNQKTLLDNCRDVIRFTTGNDEHTDRDTHRNRIESRTVKVFKDQKDLIEDIEWGKYLRTVIQVHREVGRFNTKTREYEETSETAIYVSNFDLSAREAATLIREHWHIENKNHYVRDVSLGEDRSRIRISPENMSTIRSFALNVMRRNGVGNINEALYRNSLNYYALYGYQQFI